MNLPESIVSIDVEYLYAGKVAIYLIKNGERVAIVDNNTRFAVPKILAGLKEHGYTPEQVEYAIVTHVHLDHAGGTAELLAQCPNATALAHPKAARHLIEPTRLIAGTKAVYGADFFDKLYGVIDPVPRERIRIMEDGETIDWHGRPLRFFYTYGHASHHFSIHDPESGSVFSGDSFGVGRSEAARPGPSFVVCSSSPTDFDAVEAHKSVDKILATGAARAYPTHFGPQIDMHRAADQLRSSIDAMERIRSAAVDADAEGEALTAWCKPQVAAAMNAHLEACGVVDFKADRAWLDTDVELNSMGLAFAAERARKARAQEQQS